jgi:signal transduction histidine kinase
MGQDPYIDSLKARLKTANDTDKVYILSELSRSYMRYSLLTSMELALEAKGIADSLKVERLQAEAINRIGSVHLMFSNTEKATVYILKGLRMREKIHDSLGIAYSYTNLALLYAANNDFEKAIEYNEKSIELKKALGMESKLGANYNNMINYYNNIGNLDQALIWGYKTLEVAKKYHNSRDIGDAYLNIGSVYHWMNKYRKAEENYLNSLHIADSLNDISGILQSLINLSALFLETDHPEKAVKMLRRAEPLVTEYGDLKKMEDFYANYSKYFQMTGNMKQGWEKMKKHIHIHDSIASSLSVENITNMQIEHEAQDLEYQIEALRKDRIIKEMILKKEKRSIIAFLVFAVVIVLLILYFLHAIRKVDRLKKQLNDKNKYLEEANKELIESEKKLESMVRTKDKFFSIIAHDLINPFQPLLGLSELLVTDIDKLSDEEIKKYAGLIKESAIRSYNLLSNLLKWTQSQTGRLSFNPEEIYLSAIIDEILSFYKENARIKNIHLLNHTDKDLIVYADRELLSSIIRNLVSNAIKFTGRNGYVKIGAVRKGKYVEISVEDNGVGIEEEKLKDIFKLESASTTKGTENEEGSGLGLILCKEFVEKNNGEIWVKSKKGKGTTFFFTIPAAGKTSQKDQE